MTRTPMLEITFVVVAILASCAVFVWGQYDGSSPEIRRLSRADVTVCGIDGCDQALVQVRVAAH